MKQRSWKVFKMIWFVGIRMRKEREEKTRKSGIWNLKGRLWLLWFLHKENPSLDGTGLFNVDTSVSAC